MYMWCPHEIGRDSWDRGGQESVGRPDFNSPQELGEEALTERTPLGEGTERPQDEVIVEYYCFLKNIIVEPPGPRPPRLASAPCTFCLEMVLSSRRGA